MSALALRKLHFACPACKRALRAVGGMQTATQVVTRKCPGCRRWWQIALKPTASLSAADVCEIVEITR